MSRGVVMEAQCSRTGTDAIVAPLIVKARQVVYDPICRYIAGDQYPVVEVVGGE